MLILQYFPFLLDLVTSGKYDPSFVFTHKGPSNTLTTAPITTNNYNPDKFENVSKSYADFNNHQSPGGLKICLETAFGRGQSVI